jgi:hypothetical protein
MNETLYWCPSCWIYLGTNHRCCKCGNVVISYPTKWLDNNLTETKMTNENIERVTRILGEASSGGQAKRDILTNLNNHLVVLDTNLNKLTKEDKREISQYYLQVAALYNTTETNVKRKGN